jgi:hypothetical protein
VTHRITIGHPEPGTANVSIDRRIVGRAHRHNGPDLWHYTSNNQRPGPSFPTVRDLRAWVTAHAGQLLEQAKEGAA